MEFQLYCLSFLLQRNHDFCCDVDKSNNEFEILL